MALPFPTHSSPSEVRFEDQGFDNYAEVGTEVQPEQSQDGVISLNIPRIRCRSPSFDDSRYLHRLQEIHDADFIEFRAPPYTTDDESRVTGDEIEEIQRVDECQEVTIRYSMAFSQSTPIMEGVETHEVTQSQGPPISTIPNIIRPSTRFHPVDLRFLKDALAGTMHEYIRLRNMFPTTPRVFVGLSAETTTIINDSDTHLRHLVLKHQHPGAFRTGQSFYAHGSITGEWELGETKGTKGKKKLIQWVNHNKKLVAIVEMDPSHIQRTTRERITTMMMTIRAHTRFR
ncbi:hypothetical protein B0H16DRAFT_1709951 [Mycena metata]|uniref:Uncharacterized protein n=1 Tax=Mycena metata TaxID=1033252 RepID=A0AAD7KD34_9AGAR|nr:hypothetical protein B0H16DRAFT_1709951 [Mycena metata]